MKRVKPSEMVHGSTSDLVIGVVDTVPSLRFVIRLDEALESRGITQNQLALATGIRAASISEFIKGNKSALNKMQLLAIMVVLRITDIREVIDVEFDLDIKEQFDQEAKAWKEDRVLPQGVVQLLHQNLSQAFVVRKSEE